MARRSPPRALKALDADPGRIGTMEIAARAVTRSLVAPGLALAFMVVAGIGASVLADGRPLALAVVAAAAFGAQWP